MFFTRGRKNSPFRASWSKTIADLASELKQIKARQIVLEMALQESDITLDGSRPRAGTSPAHPGVVLSFESQSGPLRFASDAFISWEDNIRAIALGMGDLRRLERYGITKRGEQYTGWRQLPPAANPGAGPAEPTNPKEAITTLFVMSGTPRTQQVTKDQLKQLYRAASMKHHPDQGGNTANFNVVSKAWQILKATYSL